MAVLQAIFQEYERISGLALNVSKTVLVPLSQFEPVHIRARLAELAPLWGAVIVDSKAKYLGFYVGPGRGLLSWEAAFKKFIERARLWGTMGLGLFHTVDAYRVFVASVLMFVAQLDPLPPDFGDFETRACRTLFRGPPGWMTTGFLKGMKSAAFPIELPDIRAGSVAARARVAVHENATHGGLQIARRARSLRLHMASAGGHFCPAYCGAWLRSCFILSLESAWALLWESGPDGKLMLQAGREEHHRDGWQARAIKLLSARNPLEVQRHVRRRLDRWNIQVLPGRRVARWLESMKAVSTLLPPRVQACQFRTAFDGWVTGQGQQRRGTCVLGCPGCHDALDHYAMCPRFHDLCRRWLGLGRPPVDQCLADFLGIATSPASVPRGRDWGAAQAAALRAVGVYALYRLHTNSQHQGGNSDVTGLFRGFVREGVRGHAKAMSLISSIVKRRRSDS